VDSKVFGNDSDDRPLVNSQRQVPDLSEAFEEAKASLDLNDPRLQQMAEIERRTRKALASDQSDE